MKKKLWIVILTVAKIISLFWHNKWDWKQVCAVNPDELLIAEVAINYHKGLGYVSSMEIISKEKYQKTALRPSFPVFTHIFLMSWYQKLNLEQSIELSTRNSYFLFYGAIIQIFSLLLFISALLSFQSIASFYFQGNTKWVLLTTIFFGVYPSVLLYVGGLTNYENIAMPLIIVTFRLVLKAFENPVNGKHIILVTFAVVWATLVRPQTFFVFFFIFLWIIAWGIFKKKLLINKLLLGGILSIFIFLANLPALLKNKELFGKYLVSTQIGFSFFEGHNPFARGSWCGDCGINPERPVFKYVREQIKDFENLNEFERSNALKDLAWQWIKENPLQEIILTFRKIAIYFLPYNSDHNYFNPLNLFVHLGFLSFVFFSFWKRNFTKETILLLTPIIGSIVLSIIFFVGYRWRYYAEPFMIIAAMLFVKNILTSKIKNYAVL